MPCHRLCQNVPKRSFSLYGTGVNNTPYNCVCYLVSRPPARPIPTATWTWPYGQLIPSPPLTRLRWLRELETALDQDVSLVLASQDLDPVLGFEIMRQGYLVFEDTPGKWEKSALNCGIGTMTVYPSAGRPAKACAISSRNLKNDTIGSIAQALGTERKRHGACEAGLNLRGR